jgi:hypothetical protein
MLTVIFGCLVLTVTMSGVFGGSCLGCIYWMGGLPVAARPSDSLCGC